MACAGVTANPTASVFPMGSTLFWRVFQNSSIVSSLTGYLNSRYNLSTSVFVNIPGNMLTTGRYILELKLDSAYGCHDAVNSSFTVIPGDIQLQVNIAELSPMSLLRNDSLNLHMTTALISCLSSSLVVSKIATSWSIHHGLEKLDLNSTSLDPRIFSLPAYTLNITTTYTVTAFGSFTTADGRVYNGSASIDVQVSSAGVVALIAGGSSRVVSAHDDLLLDASGSMDVDYPSCITCLSYIWSCADELLLFPCEISLPQIPSLSITSGTLAAGRSYLFGLNVSNSRGSTASTYVSITLVGDYLPMIDLFTLGLPSKVNVGSNLVLQALINSSFDTFANWTSHDVIITAVNKTATMRYFSPQSSTLFQLGIDTSSFNQGESYIFSISASYFNLSPVASTATLTVTMNKPPWGGSFTVAPGQGVALNTTVHLLAASWTDDISDFPLQYAFGYLTTDFSPVTLRRASAINYLSTLLGQGTEENDFNVTVFAYVYDVYSGRTIATSSVKITSAPVSEIISSSLHLLSQAMAYQNAASMTQIISGVTAAINAQNCSVLVNCDSLNRRQCFSVPNTCGPCVSGYVGVEGDSNLPCIEPQIPRGDGLFCTSNDQCLSGHCYDNLCEIKSKLCANNCSSHGVCIFYDLNHESVPSCELFDSTCVAECNCDAQYFGSYCSMDFTAFNASSGVRENLCSNLYWTLSREDSDSDVVSTRAELITSILLDVSLISEAAILNCSSALMETVFANPNLLENKGTAISVIKALSAVTRFGYNLSSSIVTALNAALQAIVLSLQASTLPGEAPLDIFTNNIKLRTLLFEGGTLNDSILALPLSYAERLFNRTTSQVKILSSTEHSGSIGVALIEFSNNLANGTLLAPDIQIQISATGTAGRRRLLSGNSTYSALILSPISVNQSSVSNPVSGTVSCLDSSVSYNISIDCGAQSIFFLPCPAHSIFSYSYQCPGQRTAPACLVRVGDQLQQNPSCEVLNSTATSILCRCELISQDALTLGQDISLDLATSLILIGTSFSARVESSASLPSTNFKNHILVTASTSFLLAGIFIGLVVFINLDARELKKYVAMVKASQASSRKLERNIHSIFDALLPVEFGELPWHVRWWRKILEEHDWMCLFVPYADGGN